MTQKFVNLFKSGRIGKLSIKNRIVMLAIATNFASETGGINQQILDYYTERAKGGVGLIIVENSVVDYSRGRNGANKFKNRPR